MNAFTPFFAQPFLATIDSLLTLVVFILISAAAAVFNKKKKSDELRRDWSDDPTAPPARGRQTAGTPPRQPKATDWEVELRRLLEGEAPSAPPPAAPPPIVVYEPPRPRPAPPPIIPRPVHVLPAPLARPVARPVAVIDSEGGARAAKPANLAESAQAYHKASQLDVTMAAHPGQVTHQRVGLTSVKARRQRSAEVEQMLSLLRTPRSARQAIIASAILGPPRGLEDEFSF